ncbi:hypothetical protein E2C01_013365 [Portunus trituberculatus]|uniref:Uncharacterized protein n=1 Tax=Portunus trituberculatus TaxID=210409 RepID=A0A5B7DG06_PORTR|nr:hypothetical protein [Portunus trituberculatus]
MLLVLCGSGKYFGRRKVASGEQSAQPGRARSRVMSSAALGAVGMCGGQQPPRRPLPAAHRLCEERDVVW